MIPVCVSPRAQVQSSIFTAHPDGRSLREVVDANGYILKIVIPQAERKRFLMRLEFLGVNRASLFPDLDGVCAWLRWKAEPGVSSGIVLDTPDVDSYPRA